jgi:hypothetical protein
LNQLLDLLQAKGTPSVVRLKRLYRRLCKKTHPDLTRESQEKFVRLHQSYEEALQILSQGRLEEKKPGQVAQPTGAALRGAVLRNLYRFALKFNGLETEQVFSALLEQVKLYRMETYHDLVVYQSIFLRTFDRWHDDGKIYYTHNLWIACIRELAFYYSFGLSRYRTLLEGYLRDLEKRVVNLDEAKRGNLLRLAGWLAEEAAGEKVQIIYEE